MELTLSPGIISAYACSISLTAEKKTLTLELVSFSIDDGDGNDNATNKQFDWSSEETKRAARVARNYEQVRAILYKTTTWNYNVYRFDDNLGVHHTALILCI